MATKRKPCGYRPSLKLPYAIYWGSESLYGKIYQILGEGLKETVGLKQTHFLLEGNVYQQLGNDFSHDWPIQVSHFSRLIEFKTKECLEAFLSNPRIDFSPAGSDSKQPIASEG